MSGPNVPLLRKTLEHIEAHPEEWKQKVWRCNSGMCFAGWAATLHGAEWAYAAGDDTWRAVDFVESGAPAVPGLDEEEAYTVVIDDNASLWPVGAYAGQALGLGEGDAEALFAPHNTLPAIRGIVDDICEAAS